MTVVSYRLHCQKCPQDEVVRRSEINNSSWKIINLPFNEAICPDCDEIDTESSETDSEGKEINLKELDNIGEKAAQNLREAGYDTDQAIAAATDDELLDISWVGEKGLLSLKNAVGYSSPKERW